MMCRARLMRRFPARDSRWRFWSPEEASMGAVPFQEAKWRAAGEPADVADVADQPGGAGRADAVQVLQPAAGGWRPVRSAPAFAILIFLSITASSWISSEASQRRVLPTTSRGRTVLSSARACWADRNFFAPAFRS